MAITNSNLIIENGRIVVYVTDDLKGKFKYEVPYMSDINILLTPINESLALIKENTPIVKIIESKQELDNPPNKSIYILHNEDSFTLYQKLEEWKEYKVSPKEVEIKTSIIEKLVLPIEVEQHLQNTDIHSSKDYIDSKLEANKTINGKSLITSPTLYGTDIKISDKNIDTIDKILKNKADINNYYTKEELDAYFIKKELSTVKKRKAGRKWKGKEVIIQEFDGTLDNAVKENIIAITELGSNIEEIINVYGNISDGKSLRLINNYSVDFWSSLILENNILYIKSLSSINRTKKTGAFHIKVELIEV
jgi:hypothetical protein